MPVNVYEVPDSDVTNSALQFDDTVRIICLRMILVFVGPVTAVTTLFHVLHCITDSRFGYLYFFNLLYIIVYSYINFFLFFVESIPLN